MCERLAVKFECRRGSREGLSDESEAHVKKQAPACWIWLRSGQKSTRDYSRYLGEQRADALSSAIKTDYASYSMPAHIRSPSRPCAAECPSMKYTAVPRISQGPVSTWGGARREPSGNFGVSFAESSHERRALTKCEVTRCKCESVKGSILELGVPVS